MDHKPLAKKLSKGLLDLKFMKKSKERAEVQEENEERQQLYQDQLQSLHEGADRIVLVNSYIDCMDFLPGRLSFGGMDPEVEKINEDKLFGLYRVIKAAPPEVVTAMDTDVTVEEMSGQYKKRKSDHLDNDPWSSQEPSTNEEGQGNEDGGNGGKRMKKSNLRPIFRGRSRGWGNNLRGRGSFRGRKQGREDGFNTSSNGENQGRDFQGKRQGGGPKSYNKNGYQGRGDFRGKGQGRGDFRGKGQGRGDFRGKGQGRGDFRGKGQGRGDFRGKGQGRGDFRGKGQGRGDFRGKGQGRGDFKGKGQGGDDFRGKGQGGDDFRGKGQGGDDFRGKGQGGDDFRGKGQGGGPNRSYSQNENSHKFKKIKSSP